ncbi:MAG: CinA family protein [Candidatus Nanopelagicales bacterium]
MIAGGLIAALTSRGLRVATAESLTGGLLCGELTAAPGSSAAVAGGIVAYSNEVKRDLLGVPAAWLADPGPVSAQVAAAMATGALNLLQVGVAVSTTGEAGPDSGSGQPVGTVFVAVVGHGTGEAVVRRLSLTGSREEIRAQSVAAGLEALSSWLGTTTG